MRILLILSFILKLTYMKLNRLLSSRGFINWLTNACCCSPNKSLDVEVRKKSKLIFNFRKNSRDPVVINLQDLDKSLK